MTFLLHVVALKFNDDITDERIEEHFNVPPSLPQAHTLPSSHHSSSCEHNDFQPEECFMGRLIFC